MVFIVSIRCSNIMVCRRPESNLWMSRAGLEVRVKLFEFSLATELPAANERDHEENCT